MEQDSLKAADVTHKILLEKELEGEIKEVNDEISKSAAIRALAGPPIGDVEMAELDRLYDEMSRHVDEKVRFNFGIAYNIITRVYLDNTELKARLNDFIGVLLRASILSEKKYRALGGNRDRLDVMAQKLNSLLNG